MSLEAPNRAKLARADCCFRLPERLECYQYSASLQLKVFFEAGFLVKVMWCGLPTLAAMLLRLRGLQARRAKLDSLDHAPQLRFAATRWRMAANRVSWQRDSASQQRE